MDMSDLSDCSPSCVPRYLVNAFVLMFSSEIKPNQIRLGEHSDYCTMSLVFQRDTGGLQVKVCTIIIMKATQRMSAGLARVPFNWNTPGQAHATVRLKWAVKVG